MSGLIQRYFPELDHKQLEQFAALPELYAHWNAQINVISRKDIDALEERHLLHALAIAKVIRFKAHTRILDVGTGGGFPGIPLAICFPDCEFVLVDSIGKKIKVVNEIAAAIGLKNVRAYHMRAEDQKEQFHFVVSRAVTAFPQFYNWVRLRFSREQFNDLPNGILYLKGGDLREEFGKFYTQCRFYDISEFFEEDFFLTKKVVYLNMKA